MSDTVGIAELRQNLSKHLERVKAGERLIVTDRNRPVAVLAPPPTRSAALEQLVSEGRVQRSKRSDLPASLPGDGSDWTAQFIAARREED